jgi:hypothetical protein
MKDFFAKLKYLFRWRDVAFAVLLLGITVLFAFCSSENMMDVTFGEEAVDIATQKYTMNIPYEMVESIEIAPYSEEDEQVRGRSDMALRTGIWQNESWGEYYACLDLQTDTCILVHLNDGRIFVFSHKSDEKVASDFETFQSYLNP